MALANYSDMSTAIQKWLNREGFTELTDRIDDFLAIGQRRIHYDQKLNLNAMLVVDSAFTIDSQTETLPTGLLRVESLSIIEANGTHELRGSPLRRVLQYTNNERPLYYAVVGDNFYFGPPPDQSYTATLIYRKGLDVLTSGNTTNWFTDNYPEILLYAALVEACLFLKDDKRAAPWNAQYEAARDRLSQMEENKDKEPGGLVVRAV